MVDPSKAIRFAVTLVYSLFAVIAVAPPSSAAADSLGEAKFEGTAPCGHRFEPGPIVNGHSRQPTPAEFEARRQELQMLNSIQGQASTCRAR